jgi:hypothetical protein
MSLIVPLALLLGFLAVPIVLLYMLRLRREEMLVSSTLLWQKLLRDREANAPWQKLRRNLLLFLQLLVLAMLVLALARPFLPVPSVASGSVIVLLDGSASMQATDMETDRFSAARQEVGQWINDLGANDQMTLILAGPQPAVLAAATNDKIQLREALASAAPAPAEADWNAAITLATGAAQGVRDARLVIVSDGGLPADLPALPVETVYMPVGNSGENLAITALATRNTETGPQLFARITNTGARDQDTILALTLDGVLADSQRVNVPAGEVTNLSWDLPADVGTITAQLSEQTEDYLALDDTAWAVHEGGVSNRALLVTEGNIFLEQLFSILPGINLFKAAPDADQAALSAESFDLYIYDGVPLPQPPPAGDLLIINPQDAGDPAGGEDRLLTVTGTFSNTTVTRLADSPLLQFVDWTGVDILAAQNVNASWAQPLVSAAGGPLLLVGEPHGYRAAILTFDLHASDLPLQIAFPVLMANITNWLNPGRAFDAPGGLQPGDPVVITPGASATHVLVEKPDGSNWLAEVGEAELTFVETQAPGLYTLRLRDATGEQLAGQFAVNLFSITESNLTPAPIIQIGQTEVTEEAEANIGQRELWPWLAGLAFLLLMAEWWVHFQGARLPRWQRT